MAAASPSNDKDLELIAAIISAMTKSAKLIVTTNSTRWFVIT
jgi:hypothetical protein